MKFRLTLTALILYSQFSNASILQDTVAKDQRFNFHFQNTLILQYHPAFNAKYSGLYSLSDKEEKTLSVSSTFFIGMRLWKGASFYFNPEINGGSGFSQTRGVAGFPNGEVYRVDNPAPKIYIARLYFSQVIPLDGSLTRVEDDYNQLRGLMPGSYISLKAGKFSVLDFFDNNKFSHEPRTQFFNWALMGNGAWDYPANTRGYTFGFSAELVKPRWAVRIAAVMVPRFVNGNKMDFDISRARSHALELEHSYKLGEKEGTLRFIAYYTLARMGSYRDAINWGIANNLAPEVDSVNRPGHTKLGFGINIEQNLTKSIGFFMRAGWNDGHYESWAFTEIDRTLTAGLSFDGEIWNRNDDCLGAAVIVNGISGDHREYLSKGGYGFIIGDGALNYATEKIAELYYSFRLDSYPLWMTPDYQLIIDPAYNKDRGPVHAFGLRILIAF